MRKIHLNSYAKNSQNVTGGEISQTVMQKLRKLKISQTVMQKLRKALSGLKMILAQGKVTPVFRCLKGLRQGSIQL